MARALVVPTIAALLGACQGEYPIAPTLCDELCHAQESVKCGTWLDNPVDCVLQCEALRAPTGPDCDARLRGLVSCLQALPAGSDYCRETPCGEQYTELRQCESMSTE